MLQRCVKQLPVESGPEVISEEQLGITKKRLGDCVVHYLDHNGGCLGVTCPMLHHEVMYQAFKGDPDHYESTKLKQRAVLKKWRHQYNHRVEGHYSGLASGANPTRATSLVGSGPVSLLADQTARRHLKPIKKYVASEDRSGG